PDPPDLSARGSPTRCAPTPPPPRDSTREPACPRPPARRTGPARSVNRAGMEATAAAVGPQLSPDVLLPRELSRGPHARLHRALFAARGRRPRSLQRPRYRAPPG